MTWLEWRLPPVTSVPARAARIARSHLRLRFGLILAAWALVCLHWFDRGALPFQIAIAGAVLWHAASRERLLQVVDEKRVALELLTSAGVATAEAQLRSAEERYRALVETLPLATYIFRPGSTTGVVWVSPQIAEISSYTPDEWMTDDGLFRKVLHPDDRERVFDELARVEESGEALDHEYRMVRRDGSVVWLHDSGVTVEIDGVQHTRGFIVDVTDRRTAELERDETLVRELEQNEQLRELDRLKDEFVALVSHELRTPLTSIRGYLELMIEDTNLTDEQDRFLDTIDRNAQRLQRVVGDLLFCAQVEAGQLTLEQGNVDVNALVEESLRAAGPSAAAKAIELHTDLAELPHVPGDRARLAQVLDNFVSNAIKFTPGSGTVRVTTGHDGNEVELTISDTGMGIPADELPKLFQRFFRTERASADAIAGTGLGLTIARAIVEGHGGRVGVESEDTVGTTFRIFLPI